MEVFVLRYSIICAKKTSWGVAHARTHASTLEKQKRRHSHSHSHSQMRTFAKSQKRTLMSIRNHISRLQTQSLLHTKENVHRASTARWVDVLHLPRRRGLDGGGRVDEKHLAALHEPCGEVRLQASRAAVRSHAFRLHRGGQSVELGG